MNKEQLIEHYFENQLSEEEQKTFQNYLEADADFAQEFEFQKKVKQAISLQERAALKKKLQSFEQPKATRNWISKWTIAASIALVFGFSFWYMNQSQDSVDLYDQYYELYPNTVAPTVRGENNDDLKSKAFYEYDNANYQKSLSLFSAIYDYEKEDYALFYKALSQMELQKTKDAIITFKQFDSSKNSAFTAFVQWYLALAYLKEDQKENALVLLQSVATTENPQQEIALKILKELE